MTDDGDRKCIVCQKPLHKGSKFCSKECEGVYKRKVAKVVCVNCGKEFEVKNYERSERKFCSHQCYWEYKKKQVKVVCQYCGKEFTVHEARAKKGAKFCSKECEMLYRWGDGRKIEVECLWCGKKFQVFQSAFGGVRNKFCSKECFDSYRKRNRVKRRCLNCGKEIEVSKNVIEDGRGTFCSRSCYLDYVKKNHRVKVVCLNCGKEFEIRVSELKKGHGKFCSLECARLYRKNDKVVYCLNCGKEIEARKNKKFCSKKCEGLYRQRLLRDDYEFKVKILKGIMNARKIKPNNLERKFCEFLQNYFLGEWRYVGDGKVFIAGFVPDFIHREEDWIIELNGDYWHGFPDVQERDKRKRAAYEKAGYKVLEIWEGDFESDPMGVVRKIMKYFYGGS
jgi:endogenous inhibitor of DNA gyrase (YacG/DUF329 family)/very-short-patch-repair endonuclease